MKEGCNKTRLDSYFEACSVLADGAYAYVCDLKCDYSRWSKEAIEYFGLPGEYMEGAGDIWLEYVHPDDRTMYKDAIAAIFEGRSSEHNLQYRAKSRAGNYVKCLCRGVVFFGEDNSPEYFGGIIKNNDISDYADNITNLRSLYGFMEDMKRAVWNKKSFQVMQIGIDNFSHLNDIFGYTFGNRVLQEFTNMVELEAHGMGCWYRMDGTKFSIVCENSSSNNLQRLYNQIKHNVVQDFVVDGKRVVLSLVAAAIDVDNSTDISVDTVYSCLRFAHYEAVRRHNGELYILNEQVSDEKRFAIERLNVIRNSIIDNCNGFFLCYQPIVDAKSERLEGAEALIRWKSDQYGVVPPVQFVDVLEHDNLFPDLGCWILRTAMRDVKKIMKHHPDFVVNVNLSYTQIKKKDFVEDVLQILKEENFPPQNLCLEITERCKLLNVGLLKKVFTELREAGVGVALDDFGTGFNSIGVLRELPVSIVKIDRSFVMHVKDSMSDRNTVRFISDLATAFSASVCAEGIETLDTRQCLLEFNVKHLQGYYYSKPLEIEKFMEAYCSSK